MIFQELTAGYDKELVEIIRKNLENYHLDIPGTAYFDPELDHLSGYYLSKPDKRKYYIAFDEKGNLLGGVGLAEFEGFDSCAELQKLYLRDDAKGKGIGKKLVALIEQTAKEMGYQKLYLETHSNLVEALGLYNKCGFVLMDKPDCVFHSTMDRFFMKEL